MKFDKETLIALIICVAVLIAWPFAAKFFSSKDQKAPEAGIEETVKKDKVLLKNIHFAVYYEKS